MLQVLSSLNLVTRMDLGASAAVLASGVTGTWVAIDSADHVDFPTASGVISFPIWSESNRDGSAGFSPDIHSTGNVTVIYGKLRDVTDQFVGSPAVGAALYVTTAGKLSAAGSDASDVIVGYCMKASHSVTYLSAPFTAIEFVTV